MNNAVTEPTTVTDMDTLEPLISKKRGRPRKVVENPDNILSPKKNDEGTPKRKPRGKLHEADSPEIRTLTEQLNGLHTLAAVLLHAPELQLSPSECQALAIACDKILAEFHFTLSGKTAAILSLIATASFIYLPRAVAINHRRSRKSTGPTQQETPDTMALHDVIPSSAH